MQEENSGGIGKSRTKTAVFAGLVALVVVTGLVTAAVWWWPDPRSGLPSQIRVNGHYLVDDSADGTKPACLTATDLQTDHDPMWPLHEIGALSSTVPNGAEPTGIVSISGSGRPVLAGGSSYGTSPDARYQAVVVKVSGDCYIWYHEMG
jgi:hypothetical protein